MTRQLQGKKVLITREAKQAHAFSEKIRKHNGIPVTVPLLEIACRQRPQDEFILQTLQKYDWIFFTSANGVACFMEMTRDSETLFSAIKGQKYAVVGQKTEKALNTYGLTADFTPSVYNAEHMAAEFLSNGYGQDQVLLVRGNLSRDVLPNRFSEAGVGFDTVEVYETAQNIRAGDELKQALYTGKPDYVTFTSPSAVDAFMNLNKEPYTRKGAVCVCIGTTTEQRAKEAGFEDILTPEQFTIEGMLACMLDDTAKKGDGYND